MGKWGPVFSQRDTRVPGYPALMVMGKLGEGSNTENSLNRNKRATTVTVIKGAPVLYQAQRCDFPVRDEKTKAQRG